MRGALRVPAPARRVLDRARRQGAALPHAGAQGHGVGARAGAGGGRQRGAIFNASQHFQPALAYLLSCKRLELLATALTQLEAQARAREQQQEQQLEAQPPDNPWPVRWAMVCLWASVVRSKLEIAHRDLRAAKAFLAPSATVQPRGAGPKVEGKEV